MSKTVEELAKTACLYWPKELENKVAEVSLLPFLLETQDKFLSILKCSDKEPTSWKNVVEASSSLSPNLFLKHLMVLSDIGGERLQRFAKDFSQLFPEGEMEFIWNGKQYKHIFSQEPKTWTNKKLNVEKSVLLKQAIFNVDMVDVAMLLLWGSAIINNNELPQELIEKCSIGQLLGMPEALDEFVKQRYIMVSRITGGSTSNDLGHVCEEYAANYLSNKLPEYINIGGHNIPEITHNEKNLTTFDLVATNSKTKKSVAIEISFQVTTNSVIERKSGLAKSRQELLNTKGHKVAYIIDGSGNFQRKSAVESILKFSDCAVNFSDEGLEKLSIFIIKSTQD